MIPLAIRKRLVKPKPVIYGVEWNQNTDTWTRIDEDGNALTLASSDFDNHLVWGNIKRCTLTADGIATFGENGRGDGLDLTGSSGRVMVRIPKFYVKSSNPSANVYRWWISPIARNGFSVHPIFLQHGGVEREQFYIGAYDADLEYDGSDEAYDANHLKLHSRTGKQPYTGSADCIWHITIDDLANEPDIGDEIAGSEGGFYIVDYVKTAGNWGGGTALDTAVIWLRKPGDSSCGIVNGDAITNTTQASEAIGNVTANPTSYYATIGDYRTKAENIGTCWGIFDIWAYSAILLLFYTEYANGDSQTLIGNGIVSKASGTGFAGENSGIDNIDTNIATNGTGTGTGINGYTPIAYRGIENLWGNVYQFIDGYNAVNAEYRIINRDGSGTYADTLTAGNYETSIAIPITSGGWISNILYEDLLQFLFIPNAVDGSSASYLYDYWYAHDTDETNILLAGGYWYCGVVAGLACRSSNCVAPGCSRGVGARLLANL